MTKTKNTKTAQLGNDEILGITTVTRLQLPNGNYRFIDQRGNILRGTATRPYTHMAIQRVPGYDRQTGNPAPNDVQHVPSGLFLTFHSTPNPKVAYKVYSIERVIAIGAEAPAEAPAFDGEDAEEWQRQSDLGGAQ